MNGKKSRDIKRMLDKISKNYELAGGEFGTSEQKELTLKKAKRHLKKMYQKDKMSLRRA